MNLLKKFALLGFVAPLLFTLLSFTQAPGKDVVTIRIYEIVSMKDRVEIYANGKLTERSLEKGTNVTEITSKTLEQYFNEGYRIETSNAVFAQVSGGGTITTYILTK